jgi:hypothetical protein
MKETAEIETGTAEKTSWDQANIRQKLGLVWRNRKKISQIIKDYFYLPFFHLTILCCPPPSPPACTNSTTKTESLRNGNIKNVVDVHGL